MQRISGLFQGQIDLWKNVFSYEICGCFLTKKNLKPTLRNKTIGWTPTSISTNSERTWKDLKGPERYTGKKNFGMEKHVKNGPVGIPNNNLMEKIVSDDYCSEPVTISDMILLIPKNKVSFLFTQFGLLVAQISSGARLQRKCLRFRFHSLACLGILRLRS